MIFRRLLSAVLAVALLPAGSWAAIEPAASSGLVSQLTAKLLEQMHYNHRSIDDTASKEILRHYLDSLDYSHMTFDATDVKDFEARFGATLDDRIKQGDVAPAYEIFNKFLSRLEDRTNYAKKVAAENLRFDEDDEIQLDRHEAPWPQTPAESEKLWRQRIKYEILQERLSQTKPEEQAKNVSLRYERLLRSFKEYDSSDVLQVYLTAVGRAYDPHTDYLAPSQKENFDISMRLSLVGIGAVLRSEDGYAKIVSLVPGGPADLDKRLKPNDRIEAVAQGDEPFVDAVGMKLDRLVQLIRGEKGTRVRLRVLPADALDRATKLELALVRDEIKLTEQEAKARILDLPAHGKPFKLGVIDLPSFYADMKEGPGDGKSTTKDVAKLIAYLKKEHVDGILLDLRRNGGGSLTEAIRLTGLFIPEGPVVQIKDSRGGVNVHSDPDPTVAYSGPLIVLTSRVSASASEILAAAVQDYGRGVVVGEKSTFGKGTVQSMIELSRYLPYSLRSIKPGALKLTIQKFYRISGGSTQHRGVVPDIILPSVAEHTDQTESSLKSALPYDEVTSLAYEKHSPTSIHLPQLQRASSSRIAASREFAWIREDMGRYKRQFDEKTLSLNEKQRLKEREEDNARAEQRKKERAARKAKPLQFKEIALQAVDAEAAGPAGAVEVPAPVAPAVAVKSTSPAAGDANYDKAPPAPDVALEEGLAVLADMCALNSGVPPSVVEFSAATDKVVR